MFSIDVIEDDAEIVPLSKEVFSYGVEYLMVSTGISPTIPKNYQINKNNEFNFFSL